MIPLELLKFVDEKDTPRMSGDDPIAVAILHLPSQYSPHERG